MGIYNSYNGYKNDNFGESGLNLLILIIGLILFIGILWLAFVRPPDKEKSCSVYRDVPLNSVPLRCVPGVE